MDVSSLSDLAGFVPRDPAQAVAARLLLDLHDALRRQPPQTTPASRFGGLLNRGAGTAPPVSRFGGLLNRLAGPAPPVRGLYLWGGVGRGKTCLMDWFVDDLPLPDKRRVHFHHFMHDLHGELARLPRQPDPLEVVADRLRREVRVLCLDEFLVTDITDAMLLHGLLKALFARGIVLVTTANARPDDLYRNGLQRDRFLPAIALLKERTLVHEIDGGVDYRQTTFAQEGVFFVETDPEAGASALAAAFARLTGGHAVEGGAFGVNGRIFPVRGLGTDAIWFDFASLCATPRATADYIEIAREFQTLFLSGVPILEPRGEAAARRFLHLVDELYDRRVKLILSAAAPLDRLYAGGLVDFAHERLLSRLREMQSVEYLRTDARAMPTPSERA